eukprot:4526114-Amphidinium_carterae.1
MWRTLSRRSAVSKLRYAILMTRDLYCLMREPTSAAVAATWLSSAAVILTLGTSFPRLPGSSPSSRKIMPTCR